VALLIELERLVEPVRLITRPVLESYALPELSMILVLGVAEELLLLTEELLPDRPLRVEVADLPVTALRVPDVEDDLPERRAEEDDMFAELVL
jgi:hypothetical protein